MKITEIDSQRDRKDKALLGIYYKGKLYQLAGTELCKREQRKSNQRQI